MKSKILFVHHGIGIGGALINLKDFIRSTSKDKYHIVVLCLRNSAAVDYLKALDVEVIVSPYPIYYFYHMSKWVKWYQIHKLTAQVLSYLMHRFYVANKIITNINPDIIFLNSSVMIDWLSSANRLQVKTVMNVQETIANGYLGLRKRIIIDIIQRHADAVFFISEHNMSKARLSHHLLKKSLVIYNTVPTEVQNKYSQICDAKKYDFVYLGGSSYIKGWPYVRKLLNTRFSFKIAILGAFKEEDVERYFKSDDRVDYIGVTLEPLNYIYQSRFLLSPFLEAHFSRPIIEAYYCYTIPIATRLEGIQEQLVDGVTGLLFERDYDKFQETCLSALNIDEGAYKAFIESGRRFSVKFSYEANLNKAQDKFCELANSVVDK